MNAQMKPVTAASIIRKQTYGVAVKNGNNAVCIGNNAPVVVQSMTNTDTSDIEATVVQVRELAKAGSELVRVTVNTPEAAKAIPAIREQLDQNTLRSAFSVMTNRYVSVSTGEVLIRDCLKDSWMKIPGVWIHGL